jgi:general secretion pathway protein G
LIELLIVIVVLGILAGVVVFALGGVTGQSAVAACKADGTTVETAIAAFQTDNPSLVATMTSDDLLAPSPTGVTGGPFLQSWPSSTHYAYTIVNGVLNFAQPANSATVAPYAPATSCLTVS